MQTDLYITASCSIGANNAYRNGKPVFQGPGLRAPDFLDALYHHLQPAYPKFHKMDLLSKLGLLAAEILLKDSDRQQRYTPYEQGIVLSNTHGSLDVDLKYAETIKSGASPSLFVYTLPNIVIGEMAIRFKIKGENAFFVFKSFNGNFIAEYVHGLFESKLIKCCICGWLDFLGEDYRALLMLVEIPATGSAIPFTAANINQLNNTNHG